jgi:hypothetical protein
MENRLYPALSSLLSTDFLTLNLLVTSAVVRGCIHCKTKLPN